MAVAAATTRRPSGPVLSAAHYRSASPTRVKLAGGKAGPSVSVSSSSSSSSSTTEAAGGVRSRRSCMCSPTNHPGSFRCSLHKERSKAPAVPGGGHHHKPTTSPPSSPGTSCSSSAPPTSSRLGSRRMGSALVRIGAVEGGECARRALAATVRPSPNRRRVGGFRPRPSRLSAVSFAGDNDQ